MTTPPRLAAPLAGALTILLAFFGACAPESDPHAGPRTIVCTTGMIADAARAIAGDHAEVVTLMGPGVDPHLYAPTRSDVAQLMSADVVFYNGLLLEGKMTDALIRAASAGRKVFAVTELIDESELLAPDGFDGHYDPHLWMDPVAWRSAVVVMRDKLAELDPDHADSFAANADAYLASIDGLHARSVAALAAVPEPSRVLVTAHDAFNYFGRRYGYEVVGVQGISTESEAGVRDIERLIELIVSRDIRAVFVESTVSDRNISALVDGAAARGHAVRIGGELYADAMGPPGTPEGTYVGMLDHNVRTISSALAPPVDATDGP
ncbi:MAG: zinc ABC transporter substrate-binding protein [Phycisphaerales bacterium]